MHQQNPAVLNRKCRLTQVGLNIGRKTVVVVLGTLCGAGYMHLSGVRPSVHLSVPAWATAAKFAAFAADAARPAGDTDRLLQAHSSCGRMRAVPRRQRT